MARQFRHGRQTRVMGDGIDLSCYLKEASVSSTIDTPETTAFCDTIKQWVTGLPDYSASLSGMFEATTTTGNENGTDTVLFAKFGKEAPLNIVLANEGAQAGRRSRIFGGIITSYNLQNTVADMVALNMDMKITGQLLIAQNLNRFDVDVMSSAVLTPFTQFTCDRSAIFGATSPYGGTVAVDYNGGLYLQFKNTTNASMTVTIEDSADNTTFATVGVAQTVAVGGICSYYVAEPTIRRYIRIKTAAAVSSNVSFYLGLVDTGLSPIVAG